MWGSSKDRSFICGGGTSVFFRGKFASFLGEIHDLIPIHSMRTELCSLELSVKTWTLDTAQRWGSWAAAQSTRKYFFLTKGCQFSKAADSLWKSHSPCYPENTVPKSQLVLTDPISQSNDPFLVKEMNPLGSQIKPRNEREGQVTQGETARWRSSLAYLY